MCKNCGCENLGKKVQYKCECEENECDCGIIEFDDVPSSIPYCCGKPMKRIK